MHTDVFPFSAIVGQEKLKLALMLNAINPAIGGVLIRGEKGTAKSTAVRALASLLPEIDVVEGCPFCCDPRSPQGFCAECASGSRPIRARRRRIRVVDLPLNATEDRVAGGIDFNLAVKKGVRVLQPGLLAKAHRAILYVDEVNLLDDHIVDIILDAAASGRNAIEREGVSFVHESRFILVGTMNPEEGELRPQLLDRFGLCVDVASEQDPEKRIELMELRESFDADHKGFIRRFEKENEKVAEAIVSARSLLKDVGFAGNLRMLIGELCAENNVAGHRADLVVEQAAKAMAAMRRHGEATVDDIREVASMALSHRKRDAAPPPPPPPPEHEHDHAQEDPPENDQEENRESQEQSEEEQDHPQEGRNEKQSEPDPAENEAERQEQNRKTPENSSDQVFEVGETFKVRKFESPKDRVFRRGSGRRSRTRISQKQGRYVKSTENRHTGDIALDATLRAAAPHQLRRKGNNGLAVVLKPEDVREKIREKRIGNFLLFLVDASGSMGARGRMAASKGAVMSLLLDAYQKRDRVALASFRKNEAVVNLPPTSSIELAAGLLKEMPVGGRTPLSAGLAKTYELLRNYLMREPDGRPIAIVITDGRANVAMGEDKPLDEAVAFAERLALDSRIRFVVVDTEAEGLLTFGLARKLATAMDARYFKINDLKADALVNIVKGES